MFKFITTTYRLVLMFLILLLASLFSLYFLLKRYAATHSDSIEIRYADFFPFIITVCLFSVAITFVFLILLKFFLLKGLEIKLKKIIELFKDLLSISALFLAITTNYLKASYSSPDLNFDYTSLVFNITMWSITLGLPSLSLNIVYLFVYKLKDVFKDA